MLQSPVPQISPNTYNSAVCPTRSSVNGNFQGVKSLECLFRVNLTRSSTRRIIGSMTSHGSDIGLSLELGYVCSIFCLANVGGTFYRMTLRPSYRPGEFIHVVLVRNETGISAFLDGVESHNSYTTGTIAYKNEQHCIGYTTTSNIALIYGFVSYARLYPRDVSDIVPQLYRNRFDVDHTPMSPIYNIVMKAQSGIIPDISGNGNDLVVNGPINTHLPVPDVGDW